MYDMISQKQIWDVKPLSLSHYFSGSAFSPDGKSLALYSRLDGIQIQDASVEPNITRPQESNNLGECLIVEGKGVSWLYDGKTIVVGVTDDRQEPPEFTEIQFWDVQSLQCMEIFAKVKGEFRSLDLSSDGNFIAVSTRLSLLSDSVDAIQEDGQTTVWNINTKKQICLIDGAVVSKFYPKNNLLLVFDINGGNLTYWDIVKCQPISQLINISRAYSLAFSKDGELLTVNTGKAIYLIDPLFGKVLVQLDTPLIPKDALWSLDTILSLSPNGHYLVYATVDRPMGSRIFLWKVER
jgi:WD40 repeat protein